MSIIVKTYTNLENRKTYYGKVFTRNPKGRVNNRVDLQYTSAIPNDGLPLSDIPEGGVVMIEESGTLIPFYLAKHDYESGLNGAGRMLLVRKNCHSKRQWNTSNVNAWANCTLRSWLNGDYFNLLNENVREMIGTTQYYYTPGNGVSSVTTGSDAIFILSTAELGGTSSNSNKEGTALQTFGPPWDESQWTRSPVKSGTNYVEVAIGNSSMINSAKPIMPSFGARPIFTLPSIALVNPVPNEDGSYNLLI